MKIVRWSAKIFGLFEKPVSATHLILRVPVVNTSMIICPERLSCQGKGNTRKNEQSLKSLPRPPYPECGNPKIGSRILHQVMN
jgi:hypothetical protein